MDKKREKRSINKKEIKLNKILLIGKISRDPVFGITKNGMPSISFDVATVENWIGKDGKSQEKIFYHSVVQWGKNAELTRDRVCKEDLVSIEGSLATQVYEKDGEKRYKTEVKAQIIQVLKRGVIYEKHSKPEPERIPF